MERARATWTDERLDDLARRMEAGFGGLDADIRDLRAEMNARFGEMNARFAELNGRFGETNGRFDALQRMMIQIGAGMIVTMIVGFTSVLVAQLA